MPHEQVQAGFVPVLRGTTIEELRTELQFWLQRLAGRVDELQGLREVLPRFANHVDMDTHRIQNVGQWIEENDLVSAKHALRRKTLDKVFDAQGLRVGNAASATGDNDLVTLRQMRESIDVALLAIHPLTVESRFVRRLMRIHDELQVRTFAFSNGGGVPFVQSESKHLGIVAPQTGFTSSAGNAAVHYGLDNVVLGEGTARCTTIVKVPTLSDATETFAVRTGFGDVALADAEFVDGVAFRYTHSENSGKWVCYTRADSVESVLNSTVTVVANTWYALTVFVDATGARAEFSINGEFIGTVTTTIPIGVSRITGVIAAKIDKSVGTANRRVFCDLCDFSIDYFAFREG